MMNRDDASRWRDTQQQLDRLLDHHWPKALDGDIESAAICLRALELRAKMLGLGA
jgi:hypothetical protein